MGQLLADFSFSESYQHIKAVSNIEMDQAILLFIGYIRDLDANIHKCVTQLVIKYLVFSPKLIVYSENKDTKLGHIHFVDNKYKRKSIMLEESYDINHKMNDYYRVMHFAKNVRFQHYNKHRIYNTIFYAKNVIDGGNVDAILIDPFTYKIDKILHLPFRENDSKASDIRHLLYCYSEDTLIALSGKWNKTKLLLLDLNHSIYNEWKWKIFATYLADDQTLVGKPCVIDKNKVFNIDKNGRIKLFDLQCELWSEQTLAQWGIKRIRGSFDICWNDCDKRCYIVGGHYFASKQLEGYCDYYDFIKDKWYKLPNTQKHYAMEPVMWMEDNYVLYATYKQLFYQNPYYTQIEFLDLRCDENKWRMVAKQKQLDRAMLNGFNEAALFRF